MAAAAKRRVFFALWPDADTCTRLEALAGKAHAAFGGRRMLADTLHMTLAFIGEIDAARLDVALASADGISSHRAFSMTIDQLRCWPHNRIVWCGPRTVPAALAGLSCMLGDRLSNAGFPLESRPFAAHATLLRKADCGRGAPAFVPFEWEVSQVVLVEASLAPVGARYRIVERWPLAE